MNILSSIKQALQDATNHMESWIVGPIWGYLHHFYLSGQFWASTYVWVTLFWSLNWVLGTGLAVAGREWAIRDSLRSLIKLLVWICALGIASGLRHSGVTGGWLPAGVIDTMAVFTEAAYLMRNLGRVTTKFGNQNQGEILTYAADRTDEFAGHKTQTRTTVTVTETQVTSPKEISQESKENA